ncbi:polysaccharide pyruvyl transferase family protein [Vibrio parahaemolyticus]|nr:polysaccharide pyruvyl transferase family protein [Vibrio parahaemolyticus]
MKVAVITFPLINNYGGIIQAYALMETLKELGHEPTLINLKTEGYSKALAKFLIKKYVFFFSGKYKNAKLIKKSQSLQRFIHEAITPLSSGIKNSQELKDFFDNNKFDACIVGSDQVFSKMGYTNFENDYSLGFITDDTIKISYAASFGGNDFQGDNVEFHEQNLKKFKCISVREESAISVCLDRFNADAVHVLDPTMLVDKTKYVAFIERTNQSEKGKVFAYILDSTPVINNIINEFALNKSFEIKEINDGNGSKKIASMEEWLGEIYNAEYVITDSFHGCVFCIIFNKPFSCVVNNQRGADRFYSLLRMFDLESRIFDGNVNDAPIDWESVNKKLEKNKLMSLGFLKSSLK